MSERGTGPVWNARLCVVAPLVFTRSAGVLALNDRYGRLLDELAAHFVSMEVLGGEAAPDDRVFYPNGTSLYQYSPSAQNLALTPIPMSDPRLPPGAKASIFLKRLGHYRRAIRAADLVYITMPGISPFAAFVLARLMGKPYFLYYASDWVTLAPFLSDWTGQRMLLALYRWFAGRLETVAIRSSLFTLAAGKGLASRLRSAGARVEETVPMLDLEESDIFVRPDTGRADAPTLLFVGNVSRRKGVPDLLKAAGILARRGIEFRVQLVGMAEPSYRASLEKLARNEGIADRVDYLGFVREKPRLLALYRAADVFVLPTLSEGFPRVVYEAMAQSLPVVTTRIPTIEQSVTDGAECLLVPPGSPTELADAIAKVTQDGAIRRSLMDRGREFVRTKLGPKSTAGQIVENLERVEW